MGRDRLTEFWFAIVSRRESMDVMIVGRQGKNKFL